MNEKKNIDKLFKEQFKDFEVAPNDAIWDNIEKELHQDKRKKRRIIPIWWRVGGIAASLVMLLAIGNQVYKSSEVISPKNSITNNPNPEASSPEGNAESSTKRNREFQTTSDKNTLPNVIVDANTSEGIKEKNTTNTKANTSESQLLEHVVAQSNSNSSNTYKKKTSVASKVNSYSKPSNQPKHQKINSVIANNKNINTSKSKAENENTSILKSKSEVNEIVKSTTNTTTNSVADSNSKANSQKQSGEDTVNLEEIEKNQLNNISEEENAIEKAIAEAEEESEKENEDDIKRSKWSISPNVAPVYFSSLGQGSSIDAQFVENDKTSEINMSYGVSGSYAVGKKIKNKSWS